MKIILVAEDIDSNYILLSAILKKEYTLYRAINGKEAVDMFQTYNPDIILMDMKMPIMDGIEATKLIRGLGATIPIVALTAFAFDSDKVAALAAGCSDYMTKPITPKILKERLEKLLSE